MAASVRGGRIIDADALMPAFPLFQ